MRPSYWIQLRNYQGGLIWDRRMLDTLAPGHFGTCVRHFGTKTNRHPDNSYSAPQLDKSAPQKDNSALVFFSLILRTKLPNFNHVCSGKDPYSVLPPMTTITLECFLPRADNTVTLYTTVVWHCEVFLPHPFDHVSGLLLKIFSIWLAHALGSGIDSKNNKNPYTVISFSLYV